jgi:hypothetical protein
VAHRLRLVGVDALRDPLGHALLGDAELLRARERMIRIEQRERGTPPLATEVHAARAAQRRDARSSSLSDSAKTASGHANAGS